MNLKVVETASAGLTLTARLGRQDKSADRGRAHVVGGIEVSGNLLHHCAGDCLTKANDINGSSAIAGTISKARRL